MWIPSLASRFTVSSLLVLVPIAISAYTHLWNPIGFPNLYYDEGIYMRRAMHVMEGLGPQEAYYPEMGRYYDHPYFGQIFLAGMLRAIGYPDSLSPSTDQSSIESLYAAPRLLMGMLAIADTILVYKISERLYSRNVAMLASILFAAMPSTWFTRMILLDSILLPFLLLSILLAIYSKNNRILILLSGISLGVSIFTKIPVFTMIPLIGLLIYSNNKNLKTLGIWLVPVILIPLVWPVHSLLVGQFDYWLQTALWQASRENAGFPWITAIFAVMDPFLFATGLAGIVYSFKRKDYAVILWSVPFIVFLAAIGHSNFFYWIPVLPVFSIAAARFVFYIINKTIHYNIQKITTIVIVSLIGAFGLVSTSLVITSDVTSAQFGSAAYVAGYMHKDLDSTIISNPVYSWIFSYVFEKDYVFSDYRDLLYVPIRTDRVILIDDPRFKLDLANEEEQFVLYDRTHTIATFSGNVGNFDWRMYPYTSMMENYEGHQIGVRISNQPS
jgi:hypothetical protein